MMRNCFAPFACAVLAIWGGGRWAAAAQPARPNIIWLIAEDFGQHLGCFGTKEVWTPNLDRLAREGVLYTRFYAGTVCSVSRSSFMTGMHATSIGAHNHRTKDKKALPEGVRPFTEWLQEAGYFTANLVRMPESCGFEGSGKTDWNFLSSGKPFESSEWEDLKSHQPFYAQVNFDETHRPFHAPGRATPAKVELPPFYPDHPVVRKDWADYLDSATELDRKVGAVLNALRAEGLEDDTIIVFFGDNGQAHARGKQFCYEDGFLTPLIIRWPTNLPAPAHFTPGTRDHRMIDSIDLAPTMIDIAGAAKPPKMQGRIFLGDRCEPDHEYIFGHRDRCDMTVMRIRTVRDRRWRYIRNYTPWVPFLAFSQYKTREYPVWTLWPRLEAEGKLTPDQRFAVQPTMPEEELFDMESDPWQLHDLTKSDKPEAKEALMRLRSVLARWVVDTDDQGRHFESLAELQAADPKFVPARDWRPQPGTPDAEEAEKLRAAAKGSPSADRSKTTQGDGGR